MKKTTEEEVVVVVVLVFATRMREREEELDGEEFLSGRKLVQLRDSTYISSFSRSASGGFVETRFSIVFFFLLFFFYY
jgi:hypothetical protein